VPEAALRRIDLMLSLSVQGGQRRIEKVWESDGQRPHRLIYEASNSRHFEPSYLVTAPKLAAAGQVIQKLISSGQRTIKDVRTLFLQAGL
jgi:hypothetical protein